MAQLSFVGLALSQVARKGGASYPATTNVLFVDTDTGEQILVNCPVAVDPSQMFVPVTWTLSGFSVREISYRDKNDKSSRTFVKISCTSVSGVLKR